MDYLLKILYFTRRFVSLFIGNYVKMSTFVDGIDATWWYVGGTKMQTHILYISNLKHWVPVGCKSTF